MNKQKLLAAKQLDQKIQRLTDEISFSFSKEHGLANLSQFLSRAEYDYMLSYYQKALEEKLSSLNSEFDAL